MTVAERKQIRRQIEIANHFQLEVHMMCSIIADSHPSALHALANPYRICNTVVIRKHQMLIGGIRVMFGHHRWTGVMRPCILSIVSEARLLCCGYDPTDAAAASDDDDDIDVGKIRSVNGMACEGE